MGLLAETQLGDDLLVAFKVLALEIVEQPPPLPDHPKQSLPRVMVFFVNLEVLGQVFDVAREQRDLHFG